jgi:hypothetical protein
MLLMLLACATPDETWLQENRIEHANLSFSTARIAIEISYQRFLWPWLTLTSTTGEVRDLPLDMSGQGLGMALEVVATEETLDLDLPAEALLGSQILGRYWGWHAGATAWNLGVERGSYINRHGVRMQLQPDTWGLGVGVAGETIRLQLDNEIGWLDEDPWPDEVPPEYDTGDTGDTGQAF